ncbi:hypothetical protein P4S63_18415 [Pseudoalteromonas sp. B193]
MIELATYAIEFEHLAELQYLCARFLSSLIVMPSVRDGASWKSGSSSMSLSIMDA